MRKLRHMGRPCEYDEEKALDRAMLVFWQRGFGGATISDLEEATGMKRQSIYNAFGDKSELYGRCIARYRERAAEQLAPLRAPGADLNALRESIFGAFQFAQANQCGACMVVKTVFDQQVDDPEITRAAEQAAKDTRQLYEQVLRKCQERGELDPCASAKALADYVFTVASGLSALAQTGGSRADVNSSLELAFAGLSAGAKKRAPRRPTHRRDP